VVVKSQGNFIPCEEKIVDSQTVLRIFSKDVLLDELVWHRDAENRIVEVLEGMGWEIQMENRLPEPLVPGKVYGIPANTYHRIRRGHENLKVKITKMLDDR
jgi:hypothetical protein